MGIGGNESPNGKKKKTNNAIAQLDDTDELQHQTTPFNLPVGGGYNKGGGGIGVGGGNTMDDEDSDGVEYLREQMLIQA